MAVKLYGISRSTCTISVMTCLHEKNLDFELVPVNLFAAEHKQPPFLAKNPFGQVPVLEDGDLTLFESRAINAYIAEKYKETGTDLLRHQDPKESAMVKVWLQVESHQYHPAIHPIFFQYVVAPYKGITPDQKIIDANVEKLGKVLDVYEAKLSQSKYLAGDFYSMADLLHLPCTFFVMKTPAASLINERPHVKAWWERISSRPAFKKVTQSLT